MKNPDRLNPIYEKMKKIHCTAFPDLRFIQFLDLFRAWHKNIYNSDGFYVEDEEMLERIKLFEEMKGVPNE